MVVKKLTKKSKELFESLKRVDAQGNEYWTARELSKALGYSEYRNFLEVARKAWTACFNSGNKPHDHFVVFTDMVSIGSGAERQVDNIKMSRYACYLTLQNANPSKPIVAQAQTYFAIQTRKSEILLDKKVPLTEEEKKRLFLREEMSKHNIQLAGAAKEAGVKTSLDYAIFQNCGYEGLYGGLDRKAIAKRKGIPEKQNILDHMGSTELAANLFRATQTEEKLRRENIKGKQNANKAHKIVGAKVRKTIKELGGTMPEELPISDNIRNLERRKNKLIQNQGVEE